MKRFALILMALLLPLQVHAFDLWGSGGLWGSGSNLLPAASAQTLYLSFDNTIGAGTFTRSTTAINPETGASTAIDTPRYTTGKLNQGIFIEESITNILSYSEDFSGPAWARAGMLAFGSGSTVNAASNPFGAVTADLITQDNTSGVHAMQRSGNFTVASNTTYTLSVFVKQPPTNASRYLRLDQVNPSVANNPTIFDLQTGLVGHNTAGNTPSIVSYGNGWYRCSVTRTTTGIQTSMQAQIGPAPTDAANNTFLGDNVSGLYVWQAQVEALSFATSPIPTTTESVTRGRDVLDMSVANLPTSQGTVMSWVYIQPSVTTLASGVKYLWHYGTADTANIVRLYYNTGSGTQWGAATSNNAGTVSLAQIANTFGVGWHHVAMTWSSSELALWFDGVKQGTTGTVTSPNVPSVAATDFNVGSRLNGTQQFTSSIDQLRIFNRPLTATEIAVYYNRGR